MSSLSEDIIRAHLKVTTKLQEQGMKHVEKVSKRLNRLVGDPKFTVENLHELEQELGEDVVDDEVGNEATPGGNEGG